MSGDLGDPANIQRNQDTILLTKEQWDTIIRFLSRNRWRLTLKTPSRSWKKKFPVQWSNDREHYHEPMNNRYREILIDIKYFIKGKNRARKTVHRRNNPVDRRIVTALWHEVRDALRFHFNERCRIHQGQLESSKTGFESYKRSSYRKRKNPSFTDTLEN